MIRQIVSIAACSLAALATPVAAQDYSDPNINNAGMQTGTRFARAPETADAAEARWMQKRVANCAFNRNTEKAREILENSDFYSIRFDDFGQDPDALFDDLEVNHCMGRLMRGANNRTYQTYMQMQYSTMRNLLAEEAYLQDFDGPPQIDANMAQDVTARFGSYRAHRQTEVMAAMTDCMTFNAPQASHDLLRARPGSGDEEDVIEVLGPTVAACANSSEAELSIPTSLIRQMAADGLWARSFYGSSTIEEALASGTGEPVAGSASTEEAFSNCLVENDPEAARAILAATSQDEFTDAVAAVLSICPVSGSMDSRSLNSALVAALGEGAA